MIKRLEAALTVVNKKTNRKPKQQRRSGGGNYTTVPRGGLTNAMPKMPKIKREFTKNGTLVVTNEEPFLVVKSGGSSATFEPGSAGLALLDNYGAMYDQYKIKSCSLEYKTAVGTTKDGSIIAGVDYNVNNIDPSLSSVSLLEPKFVGPIWSCGKMNVDVARAMKGNTWRYTSAPDSATGPAFAIVVNASSQETGVLGTIWCKYTVEFCSPRKIHTTPGVSSEISITTVEVDVVKDDGSQAAHYGITDINVDVRTEIPQMDNGVSGDGFAFMTGPDGTTPILAIEAIIPEAGSGQVYTMEVEGPSSTPSNAAPQVQFFKSDGTDITNQFRVAAPTFKTRSVHHGTQVKVRGFWVWAVAALTPVLKDFIVRVSVALADRVIASVSGEIHEVAIAKGDQPLQRDTAYGPQGVVIIGTATLLSKGSANQPLVAVASNIYGYKLTAGTGTTGRITVTLTPDTTDTDKLSISRLLAVGGYIIKDPPSGSFDPATVRTLGPVPVTGVSKFATNPDIKNLFVGALASGVHAFNVNAPTNGELLVLSLTLKGVGFQ